MYQIVQLFGFPDTFYLRLDLGFRNVLFNELLRVFDGIKNAARELNVHHVSLIEWKNGRRCLSLRAFRSIAQLLNKSLYDMERGVRGVKASRYCKDMINLKFPIKIDEDWVYLSELIRTDRHINLRNQIFIVNTNTDVINRAYQLFVRIGARDDKVKVHQRKDGSFVVSVLNVTLGLFSAPCFKSLLEINPGAPRFLCLSRSHLALSYVQL